MRAATLTLVLVVACGGGAKPAASGPSTPAARGGAAKVPRAPGDWSPTSLLPRDTGLAVYVSLTGLRLAPAWRQLEPKLAALAGGGLDRITSECGFDPIAESHWFMVATDQAFDGRSTFAVVHGPWTTKARVTTCFRALVGGNAQVVEVADEGPVTRFTAGREKLFAAWPQPGVLLLPLGQMEQGERLTQIMEPASTAPAAITPLLAEVRRDATVWGAVLAHNDPDLAGAFEEMGARTSPHGIYFEAFVGRELKARLGLRFEDPESAAGVAKGIRSELLAFAKTPEGSALAPYLEQVQVKTAGNDTVLSINLPQEEFESLMKIVADSL